MSEEIVRKLLLNKKKILFESAESDYSVIEPSPLDIEDPIEEEVPEEVFLEESSSEDQGYLIRYDYDGDNLSDYQASILVKASSDREAIEKAKKEVQKRRVDARRFYVEKKIPSVPQWKKQYPHSNIPILEGKYTGTTTIRRTAEKVLKDHGLNNTAGKYDKFVNKMWNLYKETFLDVNKLEEVFEKEFKKMYPNIHESIVIKPGSNFKNAGYAWHIIAQKGDYTLVYSKDKKLEPCVVAWNLDKDSGSWAQGHYFKDVDSAMRFLVKKPGLLLKESSEEKICTCGSRDTVEEDGSVVCNECGRSVDSEEVMRESTSVARLLKGKRFYDTRQLDEWLDDHGYDLVNYDNYSIEVMDQRESDGKRYTLNFIRGSGRDSYIFESADMELLDDEKDKDNLGANIIRAVYEPVSTANKPNIADAVNEAEEEDEEDELGDAIQEAFSKRSVFKEAVERKYNERELIDYLKQSKEPVIYIRTTYFSGGWDDAQFAAGRGGYSVSRDIDNKSLLRKLGLPGNFADFYVFKKKGIKESKKLKEAASVVPNIKIGEKIKYANFIWHVIATKGDYCLLESPDKRIEPYALGSTLDPTNSLESIMVRAKYFNDKSAAMRALNVKPGTLRESKKLKEAADVDTTKWSYSTGKKSPSGRGLWFFQIGKEEVSFSGLYSDAKKQAISYANQRHIQSIKLLP